MKETENSLKVLDAHADALPPEVTDRLRDARIAAINAAELRKVSRTSLWLSGGAAIACSAVLVSFLVLSTPSEAPLGEAELWVQTMDIITAPEGVEFYEEMEFYAWLDEQ